jgi:hypothetical protein
LLWIATGGYSFIQKIRFEIPDQSIGSMLNMLLPWNDLPSQMLGCGVGDGVGLLPPMSIPISMLLSPPLLSLGSGCGCGWGCGWGWGWGCGSGCGCGCGCGCGSGCGIGVGCGSGLGVGVGLAFVLITMDAEEIIPFKIEISVVPR